MNTYLHIRFRKLCQDLSLAGLGKGMEKGSGTRSGMLWEVERILDELIKLNKSYKEAIVKEFKRLKNSLFFI